ncbi:hypothetical protein DSCO28_36640 [Desulfosarcina ovata subsp. sediminis]|uniref:Amidohydrolase-related domain-containing protein n=1 Tax=Desulfosarcina ovata subsp. sediminis TaxID=885957 RepID=A0A5K7ZSB2_9BACT|nr:amidohydrolase family protein [Desulfosarcina ovata]BBO83098.1 hypothetical protein DSCO28_36640 [Desulfosarcina ovata subsp. sediminis]
MNIIKKITKYKQYYDCLAPCICDAHTHIGRFKESTYFSASDVITKLQKLNICKWAISSTSTCTQNFDVVRNELYEVLSLSGSKAILQLWLTPDMLKTSQDLSIYFDLPFQGIKIHGNADSWEPMGRELIRVFEIARERNLPILLHTGGFSNCEAGVYRKVCEKFEDVTVILGHGRPVQQALQMVLDLPNVWLDTAFMAIDDMRTIVLNGGKNKVLFGTDFPIDEFFYPNQSLVVRYKRRVVTLARIFGEDTFIKWCNINFHNVFKIKPISTKSVFHK